jgi:hypothetical protein
LRLHERDELTRNEGKRDEDRGEHDAGNGEDDLKILLDQPLVKPRQRGVFSIDILPVPTLRTKQEHIDQARDHRRHRERQIDERDEQTFSPEIKLRDRP